MQFTKNSLFFPDQNFIYLDSIGSTNEYARLLLSNSKPVPDGTVILAEAQTAGKGQASARWLSAPGMNLTFSIVVYPTFLQAENLFRLNQSVSLSVYDFLSRYVVSTQIKWPNDIVADGRKIAGILIENSLIGSLFRYSIIGIGVNINQTIFDPGSGQPTSLKQLTGITYSRSALLGEFFKCFENRYRQLIGGDSEKLSQDYLKALARYGLPGRFESQGEEFTATIIGVSHLGELELERQGQVSRYWFKEIKWLPG